MTTSQRIAWVEYDAEGNPMNCCVTNEGGVAFLSRGLTDGHTVTTRPAREGETTSDLMEETFPRDPNAVTRSLGTINIRL